jgi:hypothetical protein
MEGMMSVIKWNGKELENVKFVKRDVRVIEIIKNIEMKELKMNGGLKSFINSLEMEVKV